MAPEPSAQPVFMSKNFYSSGSTQDPGQTPIQKAEAQETGIYRSETERIAHDLKNCISVLLLAITSLKDNQRLVPASPNHALEKVVVEMDRLVDELVTLAGRQTSK